MGIILSLISAISQTVQSVYEKDLTKSLHPLQISFGATGIEFIFLLFIGIATTGYSFFEIPVHMTVIGACIITGIVNAFTKRSVTTCLSQYPLGIILPMFGFTPVFTALGGWLFLGENPHLIGWVGIFIIFLGTFLLYHKHDIPIHKTMVSIFSSSGPRLMVINTLLWSISNIVMKPALIYISVWQLLFISYGIMIIILFIIMIYKKIQLPKGHITQLGSISLLNIITISSMLYAYDYLYVGYVAALKRLSGVFGTLAGRKYYNEYHHRSEILGSMIIVIGSFLLFL